MIAQIKGTTISDATARLIACQRFTDDVYENIMHALQTCTESMWAKKSWRRNACTYSTKLRGSSANSLLNQ
nr:MAG TPA: hypothetical protein [Caudoviricetes sp.]